MGEDNVTFISQVDWFGLSFIFPNRFFKPVAFQ